MQAIRSRPCFVVVQRETSIVVAEKPCGCRKSSVGPHLITGDSPCPETRVGHCRSFNRLLASVWVLRNKVMATLTCVTSEAEMCSGPFLVEEPCQ